MDLHSSLFFTTFLFCGSEMISSPVFQSRPIKKHQREGKQELLMVRCRGPNHLYKNKLNSISARCHPYLMSNVKSVHSPLSGWNAISTQNNISSSLPLNTVLKFIDESQWTPLTGFDLIWFSQTCTFIWVSRGVVLILFFYFCAFSKYCCKYLSVTRQNVKKKKRYGENKN